MSGGRWPSRVPTGPGAAGAGGRAWRARTRSCRGRTGRAPSSALTWFGGALVRVCLRLVMRRRWFPRGSWPALLWRSLRCRFCAPVCVGPVPRFAPGWCVCDCAWSCACGGSRVVAAGLLCCWVRARGHLNRRACVAVGSRCLYSLACLGPGARFAVCWCGVAGALLCVRLWVFPVLAVVWAWVLGVSPFLLCPLRLFLALSYEFDGCFACFVGAPIVALPRRGALGFRWLVRLSLPLWRPACSRCRLRLPCWCGAAPSPSFSFVTTLIDVVSLARE